MSGTISKVAAAFFGGLLPVVFCAGSIAQSASKPSGLTIVYFHSENCQPCRQVEPLLVPYQRSGWDVRSVDAPRQLEFARQFNIQNLPTLVILIEGREADRIVGAVSQQQLSERLNRLAARALPSPPVHQASLQHSVRPNAPVRSGLVSTAESKTEPTNSSMIVRGQSPSVRSPSAIESGFPLLASQSGNLLVSHQPPTGSSTAEPSQRAADATVRIKVEESNTTAFGTGTIVAIHDQEGLVLTCGHLFRDMIPGSQLKVDLFAGTPRQTTVLAQLIDFKADKEDIGLLSVRLPVAIEPVPMLPRGESIEVGQSVFSIGCDHGNNPSRRDTKITHINRYLGPHNIEIEGAPAVGRSGGGLFDLKGRLIGVCNAACNQENEGIYASFDVLYEQLSRIDHAHLFHDPRMGGEQILEDSRMPANPLAALPSQASHQEIVWPDEQRIDEQRKVKQQTAGGVQVICVVRTPGSADRVVTIDQAPLGLLNTIEEYSSGTSTK